MKSKTYYIIRSIVRGVFRLVLMLTALIVLHLAAYSIWTALLFITLVSAGFAIYDYKKPAPSTV